jgi:hypothetical protein
MFWSLYIDNAVTKMASDNVEWARLNREAISDFQRIQTEKHGLLHKQYHENPVRNHIMIMQKKGDLLECSVGFGTGSAILVSGELLRLLSSMILPLHQIWEVTCQFRKVVFDNYYLIYFYHDYFNEVNFAESRFEHSVRKRNPDYRLAHEPHTHEIVNPDVKINSYSEYLAWYDAHVYSKNNFFEIPSLKIREIKFNDQIYSFDIIPSYYLDHRLVISDRFRDILLEHKIKHVLIFDCLLPIKTLA